MAKFAPHHNLYYAIGILKSCTEFIFWVIFILSIIPPSFLYFFPNLNIDNFINPINIVCLLLFFLLEIIVDFVLMPQADNIRRDDFLDNSFGSKFATHNSVEYYDNDEINVGLFKASVNLFENCFFSLRLLNSILPKRIIRPAIVLISVLVMGYFGFKNVPISLSVLQLLFSATILGRLIKHLILQAQLNSIQDNWIAIFQNSDFIEHPENYKATVYRIWLKYEVIHSKISANIPNNVFNKLNPNLTEDWNQLKTKYNIH